jgi:phosphatidylglycerophosphate synthase
MTGADHPTACVRREGGLFDAMLDQPLARLSERSCLRLGAALAPRVSANRITIAGFVCGIVAAASIVADLVAVALAFLVLNRIADVLDGAVARAGGPTALGAFLDASLDLVVYAALPVAVAIRAPESALAAAFLLSGFASTTALELCFRRVRADAEGTSPAPLLGHSEIFSVFAIACIHPPAFSLLCYIYGAVCFAAAGVRVAGAVAHFRGAKP